MIKVGIVGGSGYTGAELLRILSVHPEVDVAAISSRANIGQPVTDLYPGLRGYCDLEFLDPDDTAFDGLDVIFFATPHGVAQKAVTPFLQSDVKIIDLSADFRIRDQALWEHWYGMPHGNPEQLTTAVYGLPEVNREAIKNAKLIACPGCYPTSVQLAMLPLLKDSLLKPESIIASSASGVSGAGRSAKIPNLLTEASENFKAYGTAGHRHEPEIIQGLRDMQPEGDALASVLFLPHLVPMIRGIHSTVIADLATDISESELQSLFEDYYQAEPFVDVMPAGSNPETKTVRGSNVCRLAVYKRDNRVVVLAAEDNLTKGASGQAIQCMNIMFGFDESQGLRLVPLSP